MGSEVPRIGSETPSGAPTVSRKIDPPGWKETPRMGPQEGIWESHHYDGSKNMLQQLAGQDGPHGLDMSGMNFPRGEGDEFVSNPNASPECVFESMCVPDPGT